MVDFKESARQRLYKTIGGRPAAKAAPPKSGLLARLRNYLLAGTLVLAPLGITIWLALWFLRFVDDSVMPLIPARWNPETYLPFSVPGLGLLLVILFLMLVGMMTAGLVGRAIRTQGAKLMARVPVLRSVYSATEQLFETMLKRDTNAFREVALIEYPRLGSWTLAFVAGTTVGEVQEMTGATVISIFVPTTPNPTAGYLLFLPAEQVHRLPMSVEQGLKLIISGGIVLPEGQEPPPATPGEEARLAAAEAFVERRLAEIEGDAEVVSKVTPPRRSLLSRLRTYLVTGVLVTAPIFITLWLAWQIFSFFDQSVMPFIPARWNPETYLPFAIPGLGILILLILLLLIGMFVAGYVGRWSLATGESLLQRVPFVRGLYKATKQIFETVLTPHSNAFREVVLVEYPRPSSYTLGFVTGTGPASVERSAKRELITVYVATTPNPTSGFLLFIPQDEAIVLSMTVEEAIKMIMSGGLIVPLEKKGATPSPADATETSATGGV